MPGRGRQRTQRPARPHSRPHVPWAARSRRSAPCSRTAARRAPATGTRRRPPRWGPPASFPGRPWLGHTPRGVKSKPRPAPRRLSCLRLSENTSSPRPLYLGLIFRHLLKTRVPSKALTPRVCSQCVCTGTPTREGDPGSAGSGGYPGGLGPQGPLGRLSATLSDSTALAPGPPTHTGTGGTSLSPALCSPRQGPEQLTTALVPLLGRGLNSAERSPRGRPGSCTFLAPGGQTAALGEAAPHLESRPQSPPPCAAQPANLSLG